MEVLQTWIIDERQKLHVLWCGEYAVETIGVGIKFLNARDGEEILNGLD